MLKFAHRLLNPMQHCEDATSHLLELLDIKFTQTHLKKELLEHPNYPSLASIADVIGMSYDVSSAPLKISFEGILKSNAFLPPFLVQIKDNKKDVFAVVKSFDPDRLSLYNPSSQKYEVYTFESFQEVFQERVLLVEKGDKDKEDKYEETKSKELNQNILHSIALFSVPVLTIVITIIGFFIPTPFSKINTAAFTFLFLFGSIVSALLLWYEIDKYNPIIRQVCQPTTQINCSAVLNSKASGIMGLSWSKIGFVYFFGLLVSIILSGFDRYSILVSAYASALAFPYILFSVYYQWKIVKQWCILCLIIQAVIFLLFICSIWGNFYKVELLNSIPLQTWLNTLFALFLILSIMIVLMPALQDAKEKRQRIAELKRLKYNHEVFQGILSRQKVIDAPFEDLGITIGNPKGLFQLIKVCNPYCGPCSKAHAIMEQIIENNGEVGIQIVFTASADDTDIRKAPVAHLMAIAEKQDANLTKKSLDSWYLSSDKDYKTFASKYPLEAEELRKQDVKIQKMFNWSNEIQVAFTPTIFISFPSDNEFSKPRKFYQLPNVFSIEDLRYFLTV